jgi:hypothetical protein
MASGRASNVASNRLFHEAVGKLFDSWSALQLAVAHKTGGQQTAEKAKWLVDVVIGFFADNDDVCPDEVESFVQDIMDVEFDVYVEDGSLEELSQHLCEAFRLVAIGSEDELRTKLSSLKAPDLTAYKPAENQEENSDSDEETDASSPGPSNVATRLSQVTLEASSQQASDAGPSSSEATSMETDDDGWTVVARNKKR